MHYNILPFGAFALPIGWIRTFPRLRAAIRGDEGGGAQNKNIWTWRGQKCHPETPMRWGILGGVKSANGPLRKAQKHTKMCEMSKNQIEKTH